MDSENSVSIADLSSRLSIPIEETVAFLNTALCSTEDDVMRVVGVFERLDEIDPFARFKARFLKLEMFDESIRPKDQDTCKMLRRLPLDVARSCLPVLSGDSHSLQEAIEAGCPGIRIWCSDIGQNKGVVDEERLRRAVAVSTVPLILEGGLATPDHVRRALDLGFAAILINSAFRHSLDPVALARDIRGAVDGQANRKRSSAR